MTSWQDVDWDIRAEGRCWSESTREGTSELQHRYQELCPEKIELIEGKLFWNDDQRMIMLGLLLENLGVEKAVQLGDPEIWRQAIAELDEPSHD